MSDNSKIEWCDATWNPTRGCTKVSPGCDNCYAEALVDGRLKKQHPGGFGNVMLLPDRLDQPMRWARPRRVFVNSLSDLFHDDVPDGYIAQVWDVMAKCPQHTFQILTKRHARMRSWVRRWADRSGDSDGDKASVLPPMPQGPEAIRATYTSGRALLFADMLDSMGDPPEGCAYPLYDWMEGQRFWPTVLPNVWLGVSVENQQWADIRIPVLLDTPAAVRFLSCEPLLGPVDLQRHLTYRCPGCDHIAPWTDGTSRAAGDAADEFWCRTCGRETPLASCDRQMHWVIGGGESGPRARPMHPGWARSLRNQCQAAGVPFHFKQWGEWAPSLGRTEAQELIWPDGFHRPDTGWTNVERVGKKRAGRELDGRTWDEYPSPTGAVSS